MQGWQLPGAGATGAVDEAVRVGPERRRRSVPVDVGGVVIGGGRPVVVQSMTNTETADVEATVRQIVELADAGSELGRITVNHDEAARAVPRIVERVRAMGYA
ncbi:MAG: flavodoxin-dependent (E)-4-hydroxy-3-methylbut-2-enyl-diphosphate synthase, partial [Firmicutes bacterium]|nr:flavodoxin-dependent (E)-4-hydroxy-3-methylbut-2-enyl-diphosphate synthase [Bacillota bacterium]